MRGACPRFRATHALRQRQQAGRTPNASRCSSQGFRLKRTGRFSTPSLRHSGRDADSQNLGEEGQTLETQGTGLEGEAKRLERMQEHSKPSPEPSARIPEHSASNVSPPKRVLNPRNRVKNNRFS